MPMTIRLMAASGVLLLSLSAEPTGAAEPPASVKFLRLDDAVQEDGTFVRTVHVETAVSNDDAARQEAQQSLAFSDG